MRNKSHKTTPETSELKILIHGLQMYVTSVNEMLTCVCKSWNPWGSCGSEEPNRQAVLIQRNAAHRASTNETIDRISSCQRQTATHCGDSVLLWQNEVWISHMKASLSTLGNQPELVLWNAVTGTLQWLPLRRCSWAEAALAWSSSKTSHHP